MSDNRRPASHPAQVPISGREVRLRNGARPGYPRVIRPPSRWPGINFRELWEFRDLLLCLIWRDIAVRYKQTVLGPAWAILQPLMVMVVFDVFFGRFGRMNQQVSIPYPIFVYAGLLPWNLFANSVNHSAVSLILNYPLVSKVYCPKLLIPASAVGRALVDLGFALLVLVGLMIAYRINPTVRLIWLPVFVLGTTCASLAVGTGLSALVVRYRDFRQIVPFLVQIGMFISPVAYDLTAIPEGWRRIYSLNPLVGMIHGFRSSIVAEPFDWESIGISLVATFALLTAGLLYFRCAEQQFADVI